MTYISNNPDRVVFPQMLNKMGLTGVGAEIGVWSGWHANLILRHWKGERLIAIDPWRGKRQYNWDNIHRRARQTLARYKDRCQILHTDSLSASETIEDGALDWVYIDGRHEYDGVVEDIRVWTPKVKEGGVIAGHDYEAGRYPLWPGVKKAVDECFPNTHTWPEVQSWYIINGYPDETGTRPITP